MRKSTATISFVSILFIGAMTAPALYAEGSQASSGSMMGGGHTKGHCGSMMQSDSRSGRPNDQWRDGRSPTPDDHN